MNQLQRQLAEDKALRDAARAMVEADIAHLKVGYSGKAIAERTASRIGNGAQDVFNQASDAAGNNKGILAILIGAIFLWFARNPLLEALNLDGESVDQEVENKNKNIDPDGAENAQGNLNQPNLTNSPSPQDTP